MTTSIGAARVALYDLLAAVSWPANTDPTDSVQVSFGLPGDEEHREVVALMGVEDSDEEPGALGQRRQEESYRLVVGIKVHDPGAPDAQTVDARGWLLYETVRQVVLGNLALGGAVRTALPSGRRGPGTQPAEGGGFVFFVELFVDCAQRVT